MLLKLEAYSLEPARNDVGDLAREIKTLYGEATRLNAALTGHLYRGRHGERSLAETFERAWQRPRAGTRAYASTPLSLSLSHTHTHMLHTRLSKPPHALSLSTWLGASR